MRKENKQQTKKEPEVRIISENELLNLKLDRIIENQNRTIENQNIIAGLINSTIQNKKEKEEPN